MHLKSYLVNFLFIYIFIHTQLYTAGLCLLRAKNIKKCSISKSIYIFFTFPLDVRSEVNVLKHWRAKLLYCIFPNVVSKWNSLHSNIRECNSERMIAILTVNFICFFFFSFRSRRQNILISLTLPPLKEKSVNVVRSKLNYTFFE